MKMNLTINNETREIPKNSTITDLLQLMGMTNKPVAVEVNQKLVPYKIHNEHILKPNDKIEIVTLVGGG